MSSKTYNSKLPTPSGIDATTFPIRIENDFLQDDEACMLFRGGVTHVLNNLHGQVTSVYDVT